jgi:hypothetical protein
MGSSERKELEREISEVDSDIERLRSQIRPLSDHVNQLYEIRKQLSELLDMQLFAENPNDYSFLLDVSEERKFRREKAIEVFGAMGFELHGYDVVSLQRCLRIDFNKSLSVPERVKNIELVLPFIEEVEYRKFPYECQKRFYSRHGGFDGILSISRDDGIKVIDGFDYQLIQKFESLHEAVEYLEKLNSQKRKD